MNRVGQFIASTLISFVCLILLTACDGGYNVSLDDNFYLLRSSASMVEIIQRTESTIPRHPTFTDPKYGIVIGSRVTHYLVLSRFIVGHAIAPYGRDEPVAETGYFAVDRSTGAVVMGLTESEWDDWIEENELEERPMLKVAR